MRLPVESMERKVGFGHFKIANTPIFYIHCSDNRGFATLNELFPKGLPKTIVVHDAYSAWFKLQTKAHQLCLAHLQRDLNYFAECYKNCTWVKKIKQLFYQALQDKSNIETEVKSKPYKESLLKLFESPPESEYSLLKPFLKRLQKYQDALFVFLDYIFVPPDNNGSERALRNVKVKTKVSGQFKEIENANVFAILRSVIATCIKNNQPILPALAFIANFRPEWLHFL